VGLFLAAPALAQVGVPQDGFPNWMERTDLVLSNRARADPATELAPCKASGACPDYACYPPAPPLVWAYTLNLSSRFHVTNLVGADSMLQHPSPCALVSNIASLYPASCTNAAPSCACTGGASVCTCNSCSCSTTSSSCVTQPFDRIELWTPTACNTACGEDVSAGYSDPQATSEGWLQEPCDSWNGSCAAPSASTCSSSTENGHRWNILSSGYTQLGSGALDASNSACYPQEWAAQDFSGETVAIPKLVAGTHFPQVGTSEQFWANWYDSAAPSSAMLNVAGTCTAMTVDRGSGGNATYTWQGSIPSGCSSYVFTFTDSTGNVFNVPSAGAYQAGSSCSADYVATAPPACGGGSSSSSGSSSSGQGSSSSGSSSSGSSTSSVSGSSSGGSSSVGSSSTSTVSSSASASSGGTGTSSDTSVEDGGATGGSSSGTLVGPTPQPIPASSGCSCGTGGQSAAAWLWVGLALLLRRRR
jgi:MYXO-CTERM domain-containing protein